MISRVLRPAILLVIFLSAAAPAAAQAPDGARIYQTRCAACHERPVGQTPGRPALSQMARGDIVAALTTGPMVPMAAGLNPADKQAVAAFLTAAQKPAKPAGSR